MPAKYNEESRVQVRKRVKERIKDRHREESVTLPPSKVESHPDFSVRVMRGGGGFYDDWSGSAPSDVGAVWKEGEEGDDDREAAGYSRVGGSSGGARRRSHILLSSSIIILQSLFHRFHCSCRTWHSAAAMKVHFGEWSSRRWTLVRASRVLKRSRRWCRCASTLSKMRRSRGRLTEGLMW